MRLIVKRDGSTVAFDSKKITRAVALAFRDAKRAAIGVNCEAPSLSSFVSWLRQNEPGTSLGDKEGRFSGILQDTFNGDKIPTLQQMGRLHRGLAEAGIDPAKNGLFKMLDAAQACAQRAAVNPVDDPERKALTEFPYGLSPQWWGEVAQIRVRSFSRLRKRKATRPRSKKPKFWSKRRSAGPDTLMSQRASCFIATIEKKRG